MRATRGSRGWLWEVVLVAGLLALAVVVRRPRFMLTQPMWLDEAWVAGSVRTPLGMLAEVTSSTPVGWTLLLRLIPRGGDPERLRVIPLAFGAATVVPAYLLGRLASGRLRALEGVGLKGSVAARPVAGGALCGIVAVLAPAVLARHDLKQYTAEAFAALSVLLALAWLESRWSPRRLLVLAGACALAALFSQTALLVAAASFGGLALAALVGRSPRRLAGVLAAGAVVAAANGLVYLLFAAASNSPPMTAWWRTTFIPLDQGVGHAVLVTLQRTAAELQRTGFGPWPLALLLILGGVLLLWRLGLRATALVVPVLYAGLVVAGATGIYPFLDDRTGLRWTVRSSTFLSALLTVTAALGVVATVVLVGRLVDGSWEITRSPGNRTRGQVSRVGRLYRVMVPSAVLAGAVTVLVPAATSAAQVGIPPVAKPVRYESVRDQVRYVLAHRRPGDVVVVTTTAMFAFADYWPDAPATVRSVAPDPVRYKFAYPGRAVVVVADSKDPALAGAAARARRLWIIRIHLYPHDVALWKGATSPLGEVAAPVPGLLLVRPAPQARAASGAG